MGERQGGSRAATAGRALLAVLLLAAAAAAQYHDPRFVVGGLPWDPKGRNTSGLWLIDGTRYVSDPLLPASLRCGHIWSAAMDVDNRRIVCVAGYPSATTVQVPVQQGLYRLDPAAGTVETLLAASPTQGLRSLLVNQDGDYVFGSMRWGTSPSTCCDYRIFKLDAAKRITTVFSTLRDLGGPAQLTAALGRNIDTGNYLFSALGSSPPSRHDWVHGVLDVDVNHDGSWTTFSNGGGYTLPNSTYPGFAWHQDYGRLRQDHATGALRCVQAARVYDLPPGKTPRTTLYRCGTPVNWGYASPAVGFLDLQSAAKPRYVVPAVWQPLTPTIREVDGILLVDAVTYFAVGLPCFPRAPPTARYLAVFGQVFEPYRGRHVASVKTGPGRWELRFSVPRHPGRRYVAVAGTSGVRPPVRLPDGRKIWLRADDITHLSLAGALKPLFDPGPGVLDANGEARGTLDLSSLIPTGGLPVWIALVVLDPTAPLGIAYLPDTYVIRAP